ncbi:MAG: hypothetical protein HN867_15265 [Deltaproteobacteria bacterium]|jgi:hypothetical protein|nr:hypothetical protein [Deltaproteobacteria bacterium]MBT7204820.1 hypothetical protein [Deltaproteobacteria bacterium]
MKKLKHITLGILGSGCLACAPLPIQEESFSLANAREVARQTPSPQCEWEQANCELSVTVQNQPFRLYSEVGLVRVESFDPQTQSWQIETERAAGEDYRVIRVAALREFIYLTECDQNGNRKIQRYRPADQSWRQLNYKSLGCQL